MNKLDIEMGKWAQVRKRGRTLHVLRVGIFGWGICCGGLISLLRLSGWFGDDYSFARAIQSFPGFLVGGVFYGLMHWWYLERRYETYMRNRTPDIT